jgi:hypothetical protein
MMCSHPRQVVALGYVEMTRESVPFALGGALHLLPCAVPDCNNGMDLPPGVGDGTYQFLDGREVRTYARSGATSWTEVKP